MKNHIQFESLSLLMRKKKGKKKKKEKKKNEGLMRSSLLVIHALVHHVSIEDPSDLFLASWRIYLKFRNL